MHCGYQKETVLFQRMDINFEEKLNQSLSQLEDETKHVMEMCNIPPTPISQEEVCIVTIAT